MDGARTTAWSARWSYTHLHQLRIWRNGSNFIKPVPTGQVSTLHKQLSPAVLVGQRLSGHGYIIPFLLGSATSWRLIHIGGVAWDNLCCPSCGPNPQLVQISIAPLTLLFCSDSPQISTWSLLSLHIIKDCSLSSTILASCTSTKMAHTRIHRVQPYPDSSAVGQFMMYIVCIEMESGIQREELASRNSAGLGLASPLYN